MAKEKTTEPTLNDEEILVIISPGQLTRGDNEDITRFIVRPPTAGHINKVGGRMVLLQMLDSAHAKLLARTTTPQLTPQMYNKLKLPDSQKFINANITFLTDSSDEDEFED